MRQAWLAAWLLAGAPSAQAAAGGSDWLDWSGWAMGVAIALAVFLLVSTNRRQAQLVTAMREAESEAQAAAAREGARAERERFGKRLLMALQARETLADFGSTLLEHLCQRLDAKAAAFHCREAGSGDYVLAAHYAGSAALVERYRPGEGVAGQAVRDRRRCVCAGQAADWLSIDSGTQRAAPATVIVAPLVGHDEVPGVVELALLRAADADSLALLDEVLPLVALSLDTLLIKLHTLAEFARYRDLEALQRQVLDHISDGIFGQDVDGRVSFVNAAALQLLGYREDEMLGQPMHALTHHHTADGRPFPREECPVYHCMQDGRTRTVADQVFWRKDGSPLAVEYTAAVIEQGGAITGAVVSFRDLGERMRTLAELERRERELEDSEAKLRALFETANEGIWLIDTDARTTDLNPAMAGILGSPREALLGRSIFDFVDARNEAIFRAQIRRRLEGETGSYEIALTRADGRQIPCLFNASPLRDAQGVQIGSFAMVCDLSRHR